MGEEVVPHSPCLLAGLADQGAGKSCCAASLGEKAC